MISVEIHNNSDTHIDHSIAEELINIILGDYHFNDGEVNLVIIDDESLRRMKNEYFNQDYYTDVIAFNIENDPFEGEIYISYERVKDNAIKYNQSFEEEMKRVVIHGALHLCGEEDKTESEKLKMESLENSYLKQNPSKLITIQ